MFREGIVIFIGGFLLVTFLLVNIYPKDAKIKIDNPDKEKYEDGLYEKESAKNNNNTAIYSSINGVIQQKGEK